jgi:hypothetical protein
VLFKETSSVLGFLDKYNESLRVTEGRKAQQTTSASIVHTIDIQFDPLYTEYTYFPLSLVQAVQQIGGFVSALKLVGVLLGLYHFYGFRRTLKKQHRLNL